MSTAGLIAKCELKQSNMLSLWSVMKQPNLHPSKSGTQKLGDVELASQPKSMFRKSMNKLN